MKFCTRIINKKGGYESAIPPFTWLVIDGFIEENGLAPSPIKEITGPPNTEGPKKFGIFPAPNLQQDTKKKKKKPPTKKYLWGVDGK